MGIKPSTRYRAVVIKNNDPRLLGRIKFKIEDFMDFKEEDAPWALPMSNGADGATKKSGLVMVPKVDSIVDIEFQNGSIYHPRYAPTYIDDLNKLTDPDYQDNYPDRMFLNLSNGFKAFIDTKSNYFYIEIPCDIKLLVRGSHHIEVLGSLSAYVEGEANILVKEDINVTSETGTITVRASESHVNIYSAQTVTITGQNKVYIDGGSGDYAGVITEKSVCPYTGANHADPSRNVFCTTG